MSVGLTLDGHPDERKPHDGGPGDAWVTTHSLTYAELGERLGVNAEAARAFVRRRKWEIYVSQDDGLARVRVDTDELDRLLRLREGRTTGERTVDGQGTFRAEDLGRTADVLRTAVDAIRAQLEYERERSTELARRLEAAQAEAREAREKVARLEGEATGVRATAIADVAAAQADAAAKDQVIGELKAMLAEAHRPWWRRLIGQG
jgi:hypothetical protein